MSFLAFENELLRLEIDAFNERILKCDNKID